MQKLTMDLYFLHYFLDAITYSMWFFLILLLTSHLISRLHLLIKNKLKLNQQSLVVITGACMGIGQEMALQIAKLYHSQIIIVDIRKDLFTSVQQKLQSLGSKVQCLQCDLANTNSVQELIKTLNSKKRKIDLFIHNAGIHIPKRALDTNDQQFMLQYQVNLISPIKIIRQTIGLMEGGHIAVVASMIAIIQGGIDVSTYSSTKGGLYNFVNCFRQELKMDKKRNVTISMGCPYMIRTGMFDGFRTKLDFAFRHLEPKYVGERLVKEFISRKEVCYVYEYEGFLFKIVSWFPSQFWDLLSLKFNVSNFEGIKNRHQDKIKKSE